MKIAILSRDASLYSTYRLKEAGAARGHDVRIIDYLRCYMNVASQRPQVFFQGQPLEGIDAVIPRIGATHTVYGTAVVRQFELIGSQSANPSQSIARARDKLRALQLLADNRIPLPVTGYAHSTKDIDGLLDTVGGAPVVVKLLEGTQGVGVVLAETKRAAEAVIAAFRQLDANILVQEYIKEAGGSDIRALVVGGRVVAAIKRTGAPGDFRSNLHRGGTAEVVKLAPEERRLAVKATRTLGLNVAGVDILRSNHGPVVIEINASPGLEGVETATRIDVAGKIIEFLERNPAPQTPQSRRARG
ncbi:MAG: 30S ribosomal protein S6--L-glutamate ligase [Acidimicrobiales bacterium]